MTIDPINRPIEDTIYADAGPVGSGAERKEARAKAYDFRKEEERNDLAAVLETESGNRFVSRILFFCEPYKQINMGEHAQAAVLEGRRRVGLWLIEQVMRVDPEMYPHLLLAHLKRERDSHSLEATMSAPKPHPSL